MKDWKEVYNKILNHLRTQYPKDIEDAYDFFWEDDDPEEALSGTALEIGFYNFEDWMVCDYVPKNGKPFLDLYIDSQTPGEDDMNVIEMFKNSYISLFEVIEPGDEIKLKDHATGGEVTLVDERLKSLAKGTLFGARLFDIKNKAVMGISTYPFGTQISPRVFEFLNAMYSRYKKNENTDGSMADFLRAYPETMNVIWVTSIFRGR